MAPSAQTNAALLCQRHHTLVHDRRLTATVHPPDGHGSAVTWDLPPGSYDRDLPDRLETLQRRRRRTARLDIGPPDPWATPPPEHVIQQIADDFISEGLAERLAETWDLTA